LAGARTIEEQAVERDGVRCSDVVAKLHTDYLAVQSLNAE
jgi:hypothetical protein